MQSRRESRSLTVSSPRPKDELRRDIADRLTFITCATLFYHELAHIVLCHVPFLRDHFGLSDYEEFPASALSDEQLVMRRVLELDADRTALRLSLTSWTLLCSRQVPELTIENPTCLWGTAVAMLFRIMDAILKRDNIAPVASTHPTPPSRFIHALALASEHDLPSGSSLDVAEMKRGATEVFRWWARHEVLTTFKEGTAGLPGELARLRHEYNKIHQTLVSYQVKRAAAIKV